MFKKIIFWLLFIAALCAVGYFVVLPMVQKKNSTPEVKEINLISATEAKDNFAETAWGKQEKIIYSPRSIPDLETDFYKKGYPPFLYLADGEGTINKSGEKSFHENGMVVYLYMTDTGYLSNATMEYSVPSSAFSSTAMSTNIGPFHDFIEIVTGRPLTEDNMNALLRSFTEVFNESKAQTVEINGLNFTLSTDTTSCLLIINC